MASETGVITRRAAFLGIGGLLVTPAIVRASSLMRLPRQVKTVEWYVPAGVLRSYKAVAVAEMLTSVQPIDPDALANLYKAVADLHKAMEGIR